MKYIDWILQTIREDNALGNWLEELRFTFSPIGENILHSIENGISVLVITDDNRKWFEEYISLSINNKPDRPLLPFIKFDTIIQNNHLLNSEENISLVKDMLSIAFPNGYIVWYIGISNTKQASLAKSVDDSFMWVMDEELPNSIFFSSKDAVLDMKLLELFRLFDKSISATLYGELDFS